MRLPKLNEVFNLAYRGIVSRALVVFLMIFSLGGCATLFGDNDREVSIVSYPSGANVYMNGVNYGKTPTSLVLPRVGYTGQIITLTKPGYKAQTLQVQTEFQAVGYWNLIVFPVFLVDAGTGYMFKISPGSYSFDIQMESSS